MRMCFIADSSSIHVKRIISYHVGKKDDILVLSSSRRPAIIPGTKTIHLLAPNQLPFGTSLQGRKRHKGIITLLKSLIPIPTISFMRSTIRSLRLICKRRLCEQEIQLFDPDVIYCFRSFPEGILAANCHIRPLLLRTAGPDISKFTKYPVYRQLIRKGLQTADIVITESLWERKLLYKFCDGKVNPQVIIIGVDSFFFRRPPSRNDLRDKYGLPRDAFIIISNRYLDGHYNGWLVVEAIKSIIDQCPQLILFYITPWPMNSRAKAKIESLSAHFPRIKFIEGPLPHTEMPQILGCGDLYISFSSFDGVPNSLLEAMACGLVPIVGELPQLHEWIEPGVNGFIVRQHDIQELALVVKTLYNSQEDLNAMSAKCVSKIQEQGSYEICMERTRAQLELLVRRRIEIDFIL